MGNKNGGSGKGGGGGGGDRKPTSTGTGVVKTIGKLKKTDKTLEQKITLKEKKIAALKLKAKAKAKKGDKKGAIFCIRQIKLNQKNVEKMEKFRLNLQAQIQSLEDASTTALVAGTYPYRIISRVIRISDNNLVLDLTRLLNTPSLLSQTV